MRGRRADLDGLRGLAIALVVVFHIFFRRVSGGVDVFLVLSGFFFTGLVLRHADSPRAVVTRTLRRLYPALVVVVAATCVAAVAVLPYTEWDSMAAQAISSLLYVQNWKLALDSADYLAADPAVSPFQHLWSMAVQFQFYLVVLAVVALVTAVCRKSAVRPVLAGVFAVGIVASFAYAAAATIQSWNYYDSAARAWELLAGAALALVVHRIVIPRAARAPLAVAGLFGVLSCGLLFDGAQVFPGPAALYPVGATIALILAGAQANRLLASRAMVTLGNLAYPLYLWHWPILICYLAATGTPSPNLLEGTAIVVASLVIAWCTKRFVEDPLRDRDRPRRRVPAALVGAAAFAVFAASFGWHAFLVATRPAQLGALDPTEYPGAAALLDGVVAPNKPMRPTVLEATSDVPRPTADQCITGWNESNIISCTYGDKDAQRSIAVAGSSHAEQWVTAIDLLGRQHGFRVITYLKQGCPLTVDDEPVNKGERNPDCRDWSRAVIDRLGTDRPDWVFSTITRPQQGSPGDETPDDYLDVWRELGSRNLPLIGIRDTPWLQRNGTRYDARDCLATTGSPDACGAARHEVLSDANPAEPFAQEFPLVYPLDLSDAVCSKETCPIVEGNVLIYHDGHHLTASYVRTLTPELGRQIAAVTGWW